MMSGRSDVKSKVNQKVLISIIEDLISLCNPVLTKKQGALIIKKIRNEKLKKLLSTNSKR